MKKTMVIVGIMLAGILSYYAGYLYYTELNSKEHRLESSSVQRTVQLLEMNTNMIEEGYLARIDQDMLVIYKIPENTIYDSIKMSSLQLTDSEYTALLNGIHFKKLTELFEFLENSMS